MEFLKKMQIHNRFDPYIFLKIYNENYLECNFFILFSMKKLTAKINMIVAVNEESRISKLEVDVVT